MKECCVYYRAFNVAVLTILLDSFDHTNLLKRQDKMFSIAKCKVVFIYLWRSSFAVKTQTSNSNDEKLKLFVMIST